MGLVARTISLTYLFTVDVLFLPLLRRSSGSRRILIYTFNFVGFTLLLQ